MAGRRIAVAVTGASGAIYAARTIAALLEAGCDLEIVFSDYGKRLLLDELGPDAKVERLSARPTGAHIATDLMGHYFGSSEANDLCYNAAIGRDACRGLAGSENAPAPRATTVGPRK